MLTHTITLEMYDDDGGDDDDSGDDDNGDDDDGDDDDYDDDGDDDNDEDDDDDDDAAYYDADSNIDVDDIARKFVCIWMCIYMLSVYIYICGCA